VRDLRWNEEVGGYEPDGPPPPIAILLWLVVGALIWWGIVSLLREWWGVA
jgi:hypothetical protein